MSESRKIASNLLGIGGMVAEMVNHVKHAAAIVGAVMVATGTISALVSDHPYAVLAFASVLSVIGTGAGAVLLEARRAGRRNRAIAKAFVELQRAFDLFDRAARSFEQAPSPDPIALANDHVIFLEKICATAEFVFDTVSPLRAPFTARMDRISLAEGPHGEPQYKPIPRFARFAHGGVANDAGPVRDPVSLWNNYWLTRIFLPQIGKDFFAHDNMPRLLNELRNDHYVEPSDKAVTGSLLAFPLLGELCRKPGSLREPWFSYKGRAVAGALCVTTPKKGAFRAARLTRDAYELHVMEQLTSLAFASFRLVDTASASQSGADAISAEGKPGPGRGTVA